MTKVLVSGVARIFERSSDPLIGADVRAFASKETGLQLQPSWSGRTDQAGRFGPFEWTVGEELTVSVTKVGYQETQTHTVKVPPEGINHQNPLQNLVMQVPASLTCDLFKVGARVSDRKLFSAIVVTATPKGATLADFPHGLPGARGVLHLPGFPEEKEQSAPPSSKVSPSRILAGAAASTLILSRLVPAKYLSASFLFNCFKYLLPAITREKNYRTWFYVLLVSYLYRTEPLKILTKLLMTALGLNLTLIKPYQQNRLYWNVLKSGHFKYKTDILSYDYTVANQDQVTSDDGGVGFVMPDLYRLPKAGIRGTLTLRANGYEFTDPITVIFRPNVLIMVPPGTYGGLQSTTASVARYQHGAVPDEKHNNKILLGSLLAGAIAVFMSYRKQPNRYLAGIMGLLTQELTWHALFKMGCRMSEVQQLIFAQKTQPAQVKSDTVTLKRPCPKTAGSFP